MPGDPAFTLGYLGHSSKLGLRYAPLFPCLGIFDRRYRQPCVGAEASARQAGGYAWGGEP